MAPTPPLPVRRYDTRGKYPRVRDGSVDLEAVNAALRKAVVDDQRAYAPYARRQKPRVAYSEHGVYRTAVDRKLVSASTVVVSVLMLATRELFPGQHGGDAWLGVTVRVPSGARVRITDVFANPQRGLRVLATAATAFIRRTEAAPCIRAYAVVYRPTAENYRAFALTPTGLAVGFPEVGACYRLVATVPYATLRSHLSPLGARLVDGVRVPAESRLPSSGRSVSPWRDRGLASQAGTPASEAGATSWVEVAPAMASPASPGTGPPTPDANEISRFSTSSSHAQMPTSVGTWLRTRGADAEADQSPTAPRRRLRVSRSHRGRVGRRPVSDRRLTTAHPHRERRWVRPVSMGRLAD